MKPGSIVQEPQTGHWYHIRYEDTNTSLDPDDSIYIGLYSNNPKKGIEQIGKIPHESMVMFVKNVSLFCYLVGYGDQFGLVFNVEFHELSLEEEEANAHQGV